MSQMRSHALWYVKGIPGNHRIKETLSKLTTYEELETTLREYENYLNSEENIRKN